MPIHPAKKSVDQVVKAVTAGRASDHATCAWVSRPEKHFPENPVDPNVAAAVIRDELLLDGNAKLNLATFVTTEMESQATELMAEAFDKNMIDKDEYPQTAELESRCVSMLGDLWHAPEAGVGCSTTGSSEACMLGALALKRRWQQRRKAEGKSVENPNLVLGIKRTDLLGQVLQFLRS